VTVAAALKLAQAGRLRPDDELVLCITGNGLKTVEALQGALPDAPVVSPRLSEVTALVSSR
jgi:threonine synthase